MIYLSLYQLAHWDCYHLALSDLYSLHRIVWSLFPPVPDIKNRILFADKGFRKGIRYILIQSEVQPQLGEYGRLEIKTIPRRFLQFCAYNFEIIINAVKRNGKTRKTIPVIGRDKIAEWFYEKSPAWGFESINVQVEGINAREFRYKDSRLATISQTRLQGSLVVRDRETFIDSFIHGIGRARAFGCGLLQLRPIQA